MGALLCESAPFFGVSEMRPARAQAKAQNVEDVDLSLVERLREGDRSAFRKLVERYQQRLVAAALGVVGNYQDAEDVAQEAFLKAFRNIGSFRGQSSFYTWIYRITLNLAIDLSRKAYRRSERSFEDSAAGNPEYSSKDGDGGFSAHAEQPDEQLHRAEIRQRFLRALSELSPQHRAVIVLREIDGLSYAEISDLVACSKGTVMSRLHHARKRLQKALEEYLPDDIPESDEN